MKANIKQKEPIRISKVLENFLKSIKIVPSFRKNTIFVSHEYTFNNESNTNTTNLWGKQRDESSPVLTRFCLVCSCSDLPFFQKSFKMHEQKNYNTYIGNNSTITGTTISRKEIIYLTPKFLEKTKPIFIKESSLFTLKKLNNG